MNTYWLKGVKSVEVKANMFKRDEGHQKNKLLVVFFVYYIAIFIPQILPIPAAFNSPYKALVLLTFLGYFLINYVNSNISFEALLLALTIMLLQIISFCYSIEFLSYNKYLNENINILILPIYTFIFYGILDNTAVGKDDICKFFKWFIIFIIIACIYNIVKDTKYILNFLYIEDAYEYNLASFFDNRNTFATYLVFAIIGCIYVHTVEHKKYIYFLLLLFLANLFFTLSRTSIISFSAFLFVYFWISSQKKMAVRIVVINILFCILAIVLSMDSVNNFLYNVLFRVESGTTGRSRIWLLGLDFYKSNNIIFGTGYGAGSSYLDIITKRQSFHNAYINILVTGGIVLLVFYLLLIIYTMRINLRILKKDHTMGAFFIGIMVFYLTSAIAEGYVLLTSSGLSFLISIFVLVLPKLYYNLLSRNKLSGMEYADLIGGRTVGFQDYLKILKKRWFFILMITIAAVSVGAVLSYFVIKPTYKSDISVIIGKVGSGTANEESSYDDVLMYQRLVKTYSELAKSRTVAEDVINTLKLNIKPEELQEMISISPKEDTEFLNISVRSKDAEQAMLIANQLAKSLKKISITVKKVDNVQILDLAQLPTVPDSPRPILNMSIAFALGLMGSMSLVFLFEYLDNTIKAQEDIEKLIDVPVIGIIPGVTGDKHQKNMKYEELISVKNPKSRAAEAYRTLRTNIQFASIDEQINSIVVTSAQPGEGKSTIISNLSNLTAQGEKKVLLMDCDLRNPVIHKRLGLSNNEGLTSILLGRKNLYDCIRKIGTQNLYVITSGPIPPNPTELLGSNKMKNLLEELKEMFDIIFIDTPPVLAVTDPQILASLSDRVAVIVSYGNTEKKDVIRAKDLLEKVGAKIIGVAINNVPNEAKQYNSYYENEK